MSAAETSTKPQARLVTLKVIHEVIAPMYFDPVPSSWALRRWLRAARIPIFKANQRAKAGGGVTYYHANSVDRWLRQRAGLS